LKEMKALADEIVRRLAAGERAALCTVVAVKGSTPQARGAKMLVLGDGRTVGTIGGGCVEAEVRRVAIESLTSGKSSTSRFSLDHDYGWDDGLICGGIMDVHLQILEPADAPPFQQIATALHEDRAAVFEFQYTLDGAERRYAEELGPPPVLLIAGAGHVGQSLAKFAVDLDFRVDVVDDRADHLTAERFPTVRHRIVGEIETELKKYAIDAGTYVVIVTRGHRNDGRALAAVAKSNAKYIGLIGSKRKIKAIFDDLTAQGIDRERLLKIHAPIGLDVGAVTVPEIAMSIAAELIAIRRGHSGPAVPMKMDAGMLSRWLERKDTP
jgi:xanthine dehydrogenase accessory factor